MYYIFDGLSFYMQILLNTIIIVYVDRPCSMEYRIICSGFHVWSIVYFITFIFSSITAWDVQL